LHRRERPSVGSSAAARGPLEQFGFDLQIERLEEPCLLFMPAKKFAGIDLNPRKVSNAEVGSIVEALLREFAELSKATTRSAARAPVVRRPLPNQRQAHAHAVPPRVRVDPTDERPDGGAVSCLRPHHQRSPEGRDRPGPDRRRGDYSEFPNSSNRRLKTHRTRNRARQHPRWVAARCPRTPVGARVHGVQHRRGLRNITRTRRWISRRADTEAPGGCGTAMLPSHDRCGFTQAVGHSTHESPHRRGLRPPRTTHLTAPRKSLPFSPSRLVSSVGRAADS